MQEPLESSTIFESIVIVAQLAFSLLLHLSAWGRAPQTSLIFELCSAVLADVRPLHIPTLIELDKSALFLPLILSGTASG
jgi:hypothetical protein